MNIPFKCFLSVVLILIFNHSFLSIVRTTELNPTKFTENEDTLDNVEYQEPQVRSKPSSAEIHSSFSEETNLGEEPPPVLSSVEGQSVFKNIDVSSQLSETTDAVVFTLVDTAAELKNRAESVVENETQNATKRQLFGQSEEVYIVRAEPKTQAQATLEELDEREVNESAPAIKSSQEELSKTAPQHEDIPSFREWTQKQLAEAERKKVDQNYTAPEKPSPKSSGKFRIKNYASPDCGAKIVAANPESVSSSSVLSSSKDEYMLNYCTNRIWFVVELCEAIQAKQLDLANFELFSSSPRDFAVSISHRFPTRDWSNVGKFTAKDSRDIQTFNLNPHLFGKYIKVELLSHYGKEQFCPISWVGVFGTSEFEVLAKEDDRHPADDTDEDDEDLLIGQRRDAPKNLFISATDAVLSIVKKATAPFMKSDNNETQSGEQEPRGKPNKTENCVTPRHITVCDNCSQSFYDEVYNILSCQSRTLTELISSPFVKRTLVNSDSCRKFGLDFNSLRSGAPFPANKIPAKKEENYLTALLKDSFLGALCNVLAVSENKVVVNASDDILASLKNLTDKSEPCESTGSSDLTHTSSSSSCDPGCQSSHSESVSHTKNSKIYFLTEILKPSEQFSQRIEPTKTLNEEEVRNLPSSDPRTTEQIEMKSTTPSSSVKSPHMSTISPTKDAVEATESEPKEEPDKKTEEVREIERIENQGSNLTQDSTFDSILSDINEFEKAVSSNPSASLPRMNNLPTESIFLRLANRIKNLEINMSLSSTYLEELSRRYRNQLEMLSKTINSTAQKIEERYRLEEERERLREKEILLLRIQLANLTRDMSNLLKEKNSWRPRASSISQHIVLVSIEILFVWVIFFCWRRTKDPGRNGSVPVKKKVRRRKSLEGVTGHNLPLRRKRRPSDEALEIALSRNHNLQALKFEKKRKRKKKDSKCSINMIQVKRKKSDSSEDAVRIVQPESPGSEPVVQVVETTNRFAPISSPVLRVTQEAPPESIAPPVFIKTAMAARNSRLRLPFQEKETSHETVVRSEPAEDPPAREKKSSGASLKKYMKKFFDK